MWISKRLCAPCCSYALAVGLVVTTIGCDDSTVESTPSLDDLSAVWRLTTTMTSNSCEPVDDTPGVDRMILMQCEERVSVMVAGLSGEGVVEGESMEFTISETDTDEDGCQSTAVSSGEVNGTSSLLEGGFSTNVILDLQTCGSDATCIIETDVRLERESSYTSCLGRDEFGDPATSEYILPWPAGKTYRLNNTYCAPHGGHREQQAYDFLIPIGDPITAARAGVVRQIKESSPDNGQGTDHNNVFIEHEDGTVGFYAHLKQNGVEVEVGDNVEAGQVIALAGHSGTTDVVHLHFGVYNDWPPTEGQDQAINFRNMDGPVDCRSGLVQAAWYMAM